MKKHSVIIGSGGRLGSALQAACSSTHKVTGLARNDLDLQDLDSIGTVLGDLEYDTLWLTAALTDVDYCETHPGQTETVNTDAAAAIAEICAEKKAQLVLFSTDYVFDGTKGSPYVETDTTRPLNVYGRSKQQAEQQVLEVDGQNLVIRLSWLFGYGKPGFPDWAIKQAMASDSLAVVSDRKSSPTFTRDVIGALQAMIHGELELSGILHLCNQGVCTWQEWAQHCVDCAVAAGLPVVSHQVGNCRMSDIDAFTAARPAYSAMSTARYESLGGKPMRHWKDAVEVYVREHLAPRLRERSPG